MNQFICENHEEGGNNQGGNHAMNIVPMGGRRKRTKKATRKLSKRKSRLHK